MYDMLMSKSKSATAYLLEALLPYSDANLKLLYKPKQFFYELERRSNFKKRSLENAFYKLKREGMIEFTGDVPHLTEQGRAKLQLYNPEKLQGSCMMVIFDIPEDERLKRQKLRLLLRELKFSHVQHSVWVSDYDSREYLKAEIKDLRLEPYVKIFESHELTI